MSTRLSRPASPAGRPPWKSIATTAVAGVPAIGLASVGVVATAGQEAAIAPATLTQAGVLL
jgi:hypothetical protein